MGKRDRRSDIMHAAESLFTSRRLHEITLDDVAGQAGVGKGTIYRYFHDKDDLFLQTVMHGFEELCELLERSVSDQAPFAEQLLAACGRIHAFFHKRRTLFRMMQTEESRIPWCRGELRARWMERRKRLASAVANIFSRGVAEGRVRQDIRPEVLATVLLGAMRTASREFDGMMEESRAVATVVDLFLRGAALDGQPPAAAGWLPPPTAVARELSKETANE